MSGRPRITVVGLGPGPAELLTAGTRELLANTTHCYLRTARHPAAAVVAGAASFDEIYEAAATLDAVYETIAARLGEAARDHGAVVYAVPGSPVVAERSVELLRANPELDVELVPALSFTDLAWVRLGIDPIARGVALVDGQRFATEAAGRSGPMLVAQCDSIEVLSDVKLAFAEPPCARVAVLYHLGLPDERIVEVEWSELDRALEPDHLTSVFIPSVRVPVAAAFARFDELVRRLRRDCPWDREQTHYSLRRHLLEEAYEVLDALDGLEAAELDGDLPSAYAHLEEELGDLLFQVFFHSVLAAERGQFTAADVATTVHDKLRDRHPHVYGDAVAGSSDEVLANWEQIKKAEKNRRSVMDGIPRALPALLYALKVQKKAGGAGYSEPASDRHTDGSIGERLFALVSIARAGDVDPEDALRRAADAFRERFEVYEHAPREPGD